MAYSTDDRSVPAAFVLLSRASTCKIHARLEKRLGYEIEYLNEDTSLAGHQHLDLQEKTYEITSSNCVT